MASSRPVVVIIGAGGMGLAVAQRIGRGHQIVLADVSEKTLEAASAVLETNGHLVSTAIINVTNLESASKLARETAAKGRIDAIVHTAGVSPVTASAASIFHVDLLGTANVIDAFLPVVTVGTAMVCIASTAAYAAQLPADLEEHLATASTKSLLEHAAIKDDMHPGQAYVLAKRGNQLRVQGAAKSYGIKGARLNSISPGVVQTTIGVAELAGPFGEHMRAMVQGSAAGRIGTPEDGAGVVAFLVGPDASYIAGTDICLDGGANASKYSTGAVSST